MRSNMPRKMENEQGDAVVISGIAGRFPKSNNLTQFRENLMNKVDLITDDDRRWNTDHPDIPRRAGKINNIEKFDARFFGVHFKEAHSMDPMARMLLEHTYEAIIDAGVHPGKLRGTNTGVFIGSCYSDTEITWVYSDSPVNGLGLLGCSRSMMANRISLWFGFKGPSYAVDSACSSSLFALDHAYKAIRTGQCDAAIVGGCHLCLHPFVTQQYFLLGTLSPDGRCKVFDAEGNGYCRSEAVSTIYLQKSKDAKRIYAQVVHVKTNCDGYKEEGITYPSIKMQRILLEQCYEECKVSPSDLAFLEAHGTGTKVGDPVEVSAVEKVFCPGRNTPLRIGSVKSNLGHSEPDSGLCSIAKVIIAMESGIIPPNIHYNRPREDIKALTTGRIQVITEPTPWNGGYVGVSSFGFGGCNAHVLLKSNPKEKVNNGVPNDDMPRLVVVSGCTEEAVTTLLDDLGIRPVDVEYVNLFHNIFTEEIPGHFYRGYTVLPPRGISENIKRSVQYYSSEKRPIWFVFSGMGSQWVGIGENLLMIPAFAKTVRKCDKVLKPHGVDIVNILTNKDPKSFDNIIRSRVGITTIQIGFVDVLSSIGIVPDKVTGYLFGELGCAYADGCLTAEQAVLAAYFEGLIMAENYTVYGTTAVVWIDTVKLSSLCPPDINIVCRNGPESSIISGPEDSMRKFAEKLQAGNILVGNLLRSNIFSQSCTTERAGLQLLDYVQKVIPDPKPRRQKWLSAPDANRKSKSTSVWHFTDIYHTSKLLEPATVEDVSCFLPNNAITIEIAPVNFLEASLRDCGNQLVTNISLLKYENGIDVEDFLSAIGRMYEIGLSPQLSNLYPTIQYPVSRGTPMISPLIRWEHSEDWYVARVPKEEKLKTGRRVIDIDFGSEEFGWLLGHVVDGRHLIPGTGYLILIWQTLAMMEAKKYTEISVVFENVKFHRATTISKEHGVKLEIMIQRGSNAFEVTEGGTTVTTGFIRVVPHPAQERIKTNLLPNIAEELCLTSKDIYKEFNLRGYEQTGLFQGLKEASLGGTKGRITWANNWVAFLDNMMQVKFIGVNNRRFVLPISIRKLVIDCKTHLRHLDTMPDANKEFLVHYYKDLDAIVSGGIEMRGIGSTSIPRRKPVGDPVIEEHTFIAYRDGAKMELTVLIKIALQIAIENNFNNKVKTVELINNVDNISHGDLTSPVIQEVLRDMPFIQMDLNIITPLNKFSDDASLSGIKIIESQKLSTEFDALLIIINGLFTSNRAEMVEKIQTATRPGGFILVREPLKTNVDSIRNTMSKITDVILDKRTSDELVILFRKRVQTFELTTVIKIRNDEFTWLTTLQAALKVASETKQRTQKQILILSEGDFESGLMGLLTCLLREPGGEVIRGLLIQDLRAPKFSLDNPLYSQQLKLGLTFNVLRPGNLWGSYRFLSLKPLALKPVYHAEVSQHTHGNLSTIKWIEGRIQPNAQHRDIVKIHYSSINFRDLMLVTGKLAVEVAEKTRQSQESAIGFEFSGRDLNGRAVMGMIETGAMSNLCVCDRDLLWSVPDSWTLEDAATVPVVYGTAYYALMLSGKMKKGDKVLIHAGTGGVGQAAITLALHEGCEVFTTVGTPEKRVFIRKQFPQIDDDHVGNSRDTSFEQLILRKTRGRGVDIVLNSLAEEKLQASVRCLAPGGRFLEIGKFDLAANNPLGMEAFLKGISFHGILLDKIFTASSETKKKLVAMVDDGIKTGAVKPLVRTVFLMDQIEAAFRYMSAGKYIGKVIVKTGDDDGTRLPLALPRYNCSENGSYLILGGLGCFGLELADWLVLRGAKKLVLTSRKGIGTGYQRMRFHIWKNYGVKIVVVVGKDASIPEDCEAILKKATALGPVHAIFNLAVVLKDALFENQTVESFKEPFVAKARATEQLDKLSRTLCPQLKQFVVFSSVSCGRGTAGQTNYAMANSIMERICERRSAENLPGLAIQWGAIGDVGIAAEMGENYKELVTGGTLPQRIDSCLQELDGFLQQKSPIVSSMVVAKKTALTNGAEHIVDAIANIMGLKNMNSMCVHTPLPELGMDSIMAVEIKYTLEHEFNIFLTTSEIRHLNFAKLQDMSQRDSKKYGNRKKSPQQLDDSASIFQLLNILTVEGMSKNVCVPLMTTAEDARQVFILPGIEGACTIFKAIAGKLKSANTACLQYGPFSLNTTSIDEMADYLIPYIKARSMDRKKFLLVGYSYGSIVSIELARRLENEGFTGRLVMLDGSPDYVKTFLSSLTTKSEDELQTFVFLKIMDAVASFAVSKLTTELFSCRDWEEKIAAFTRNMPKNNLLNFTPEDQNTLCLGIYRRIKALLDYDCSNLLPIKSPVTLVRTRASSILFDTEDYGLKRLTQNKMKIYYAEGDHITMLNDDICAAAINEELALNVIPGSK
ncbi:fatty acid synthase-like isoform X1 [Neodiprion fabricii]|uniref:fatty acid synthase-like isoform X1 n=2 Tax=Neodiprion fabricii TaxID=2872261 RepID=UPI001ED8D172|nr:fatty acid synthase-like isoform X1 [Neodiprion fabricii]